MAYLLQDISRAVGMEGGEESEFPDIFSFAFLKGNGPLASLPFFL